ncbi:MAG: site-specific DNA-methyltransferase [Pirellulales bacterium]|nr:site-specific DNA-methyltransferase [Pirellulales bacterium]
MDEYLNAIQQGDCIKRMDSMPEGSVDLAFADPPFNIGYDYDVYQDSVESQRYLDWSRQWIAAVHRVLKPDGTFWLAIGDEYAAELKVASGELGFTCRSWVIWYYTFGVNCKNKFTRSHAHLFYFVKDPANFTFRNDDLENRVPSARELVYNDRRANPKGRLPDDTWIIRPADASGEITPDDDASWRLAIAPPADHARTFTLRPQDLDQCFQPDEDTWYFPRVAGTFKERAGFHGCQMPEQLLGRIIRCCSHEGETVLDPFSGSATTLAVAKKLRRNYIGFELSPDYVSYGRERLAGIRVGDRLDGSPEPTKSAPATKAGRKLGSPPPKRKVAADGSRSGKSVLTQFDHAEELALTRQQVLTERGLLEAFQAEHQGYSVDRLVADPELNAGFVSRCQQLGLVGDARSWNALLFRLRKAGKLAHIETVRRTSFEWADCDAYFFASEIALRLMLDGRQANSLDEILCDPALAMEFDEIAHRFAPGFSPLEYRWAALKLRKEANNARTRGAQLKFPKSRFERDREPLVSWDIEKAPDEHGVYLLAVPGAGRAGKTLYAGETLNLRERLSNHRSADGLKELSTHCSVSVEEIHVQSVSIQSANATMLAWQSCLLTRSKGTKLNYAELWAR